MPKASVTRQISRDKQKLIDFVLDIEKYPEFIPFCIDSKVYERIEKKDTGTLYIANHVSWFDIICLGTLLNARFIAKKEVSKMGIFGFLAKLSNTFFIDNENKNRIIEYNHLIQKNFRKEKILLFFQKEQLLMEMVL